MRGLLRASLPALAAAIGLAAVAVGVTVITPASWRENAIQGVALAIPVEVTAAAAERKAASEAALLSALESEVKDSMNAHMKKFGDELGVRLTVLSVGLIRISENKYDGYAKMTANDGPTKEIPVQVTADDRNLMWETPDGALRPLFQ